MKKILTAVAVVALLGLFFSWWFHPTNVLKRRAASFFETAEVPVTMSELARSSRGPNIAEYLADHVAVIAPKNLEEDLRSGYSRDDAAAFYSGVARYCRQVSFLKPEAISVVHLGESNAKVALRIDTIVELPDRRPIDGILKIETTWEKVDGRWLMDGISWEETPR